MALPFSSTRVNSWQVKDCLFLSPETAIGFLVQKLSWHLPNWELGNRHKDFHSMLFFWYLSRIISISSLPRVAMAMTTLLTLASMFGAVRWTFFLTDQKENKISATNFQAKHAACQLCVSPGHLDVHLHSFCLLHAAWIRHCHIVSYWLSCDWMVWIVFLKS